MLTSLDWQESAPNDRGATRLVKKDLGRGGAHLQTTSRWSEDLALTHQDLIPKEPQDAEPISITDQSLPANLRSRCMLLGSGSGRSPCFYDFSVCVVESTTNTSVILQQFKHGTMIPERTVFAMDFFHTYLLSTFLNQNYIRKGRP